MTQDRVKSVVMECLDIDEQDIKLESRLHEDLGADSIDKLDLINGIEKEFGIVVPDDEVENINTFGDLLNFVTMVIS